MADPKNTNNTKAKEKTAEQKVAEDARLKALKKLRDASQSASIDKEPAFYKPYTLLDKPQVFIKAALLLPTDEKNPLVLTALPIFDEPYNNIQTLSYDPMNRKIKLVFIDTTNDLADMLLFSYSLQGIRGASGGQGQMEVEFGWRRPSTYNVPNRIEKKTNWSIKKTFTILKTDYKYLPGMGGVEITIEGGGSLLKLIPGLERSQPYYLLGPYPLIHMVTNKIKAELIPLAKEITFENIEFLVKGQYNKVSKQLQGLVKLLEKKYGATTDAQKLKLLLSLQKIVGNKNSDRFKDVGKTPAGPNENIFETIMSSLTLDLLGDTGKLDVNNSQLDKLFAEVSKNQGDFSKDSAEQDFIKFISPIVGELKVHPANAFLYFYLGMKYQMKNIKILPKLVSFLTDNQIKGIKESSKPNEQIFDDSSNDFFIQVKDIAINSGTSWEDLFDQVLNKINLKTSDGKEKGNTSPLRVSSSMIYVDDRSYETTIGVDEKDKVTKLKEIKNNIRLLSEVNAMKPGGNEKKLRDFFNDLDESLKGEKKKPILFTFIGPNDPGVIFANLSVPNKVVSGYAYRPNTNSSVTTLKEFYSGKHFLKENNFPDVISFEPEFNFRDGINAILQGSQLEQGKTLGNLTIESEDDKKVEDTLTADDKNIESKQQKFISKKYKVSVNGFQQASFLMSGGAEGVDAQRAKQALQNLRTRLALTSLHIKAKMKILGEPSFSEELVSGCYIYLKIINADGTESFLSGLWNLTKVISHEINGGQYTTELEISKVNGDNENNRLGYTQYIEDRDKQKLIKTKYSK